MDVVHAGGAASDLTERGDLEGRVRLPPNDLDRERAAAEQADVEVTFGPGQLEARMIFKKARPLSVRRSRTR